MKVAFLTTVLAVLIGVLFLSMYLRKPSTEGYETTPECTYSAEIPGYLDFCANNIKRPFNCQVFDTFAAAEQACSANQYCRGITTLRVGNENIKKFTIRIGFEGSSDYTNLETMKSDMVVPSDIGQDRQPLETSYLITNLLQCKAGKPAAQKVNPTGANPSGANSMMFQSTSTVAPTGAQSGAQPGAQPGAMPPGALPYGIPMGSPEFVVGGESITVPAGTLVAVPAGQTIFAKRTGAGAAAGGATESTPAPTGPRFIERTGSTNVGSATEASLTADERAGIAGLPLALGLKIVDAVRRGLVLNEVLTADELATLRAARQGTASQTASALLTTPSLALSSQTTGSLTAADLQAIQQAAAAGAASVVNA